MEFWNTKFQNSICNVSYENLVSNNENEIKRIIEFCELNGKKIVYYFIKINSNQNNEYYKLEGRFINPL